MENTDNTNNTPAVTNADKLAAFLRSDSRFTRRTLTAVLASGLALDDVLAGLKEAPARFDVALGRKGDLYLEQHD